MDNELRIAQELRVPLDSEEEDRVAEHLRDLEGEIERDDLVSIIENVTNQKMLLP